MSVSQSKSYTVSATANPGTRGNVSANAAAAGSESDPASANNSTSATTTVRFAKGDLENDLNTDLVLRRLATGENVVWLMNGATRKSNVLVTPDPQSLDWTIAGVDDFDNDNRNDLVFWNSTTGAVDFWIMGGPTGTDRQGSPVPLSGALAQPWKPSATADFNHDNLPDLVYRNFTTQKIEIWTMNGTTHVGTLIPTPDQAVAANLGDRGRLRPQRRNPHRLRLVQPQLRQDRLLVDGRQRRAHHGEQTEPTPAPESAAPQPTVKSGDLVQPGPGVRIPVLVSIDKPEYPPLARRMKVEGTVVLSLLVDERGRVLEVKLERGVQLNVGINEAAIAAARSAKFRPATKEGVPVKIWYQLTIPFKL